MNWEVVKKDLTSSKEVEKSRNWEDLKRDLMIWGGVGRDSNNWRLLDRVESKLECWMNSNKVERELTISKDHKKD